MAIETPECTKSLMGNGGLLNIKHSDIDDQTLMLDVVVRCVDSRATCKGVTKFITAEVARHILSFEQITISCPGGCGALLALGDMGSILQTRKNFHWVDTAGDHYHTVQFSTRWRP